MHKRFYLLSLGCPKNTVDAEGMASLLAGAGWRQMGQPGRAELLIVNTCGFIEPAREESYAALREIGRGKRPGQVLLAAGCLAQRYAQDIRHLVPEVDGILGTREWADIVGCAESLLDTSYPSPAEAGWTPSPVVAGWTPSTAAYTAAYGMDAEYGSQSLNARVRPQAGVSVVSPLVRRGAGSSAYLKIADGCSAPCAFCAIPLIKGPQRSKPRSDILSEAQQLSANGAQEIILIAQDTTAYGRDLGEQDALPNLMVNILQAASAVAWLRLMYAYPQHVTPQLIETLAGHPRICHYLDLPLQHAHPNTLRRMQRSPDIEGVRQLMARLRQSMPDIAVRTAFIVGYPGETEDEFAALLDFMAEMRFDKVGVFIYSREEGTAAAGLPNPVPRQVAEERYARTMELQQGISLAQNQLQVGRTLDVLVEGAEPGISVGRSYRDAPEIDGYVLLQGEWPVGKMVQAKITQALEYDLQGQV